MIRNRSRNNDGSVLDQNGKMWKVLKKSVSNCYARTVAGSKNTKAAVKIQQAKSNIASRKQKFGLEYMDLVENNATAVELDACVSQTLKDIGLLKEIIYKYDGKIARNKQDLERWISGGGISTATPVEPSPGGTPIAFANPEPSAPFETDVY